MNKKKRYLSSIVSIILLFSLVLPLFETSMIASADSDYTGWKKVYYDFLTSGKRFKQAGYSGDMPKKQLNDIVEIIPEWEVEGWWTDEETNVNYHSLYDSIILAYITNDKIPDIILNYKIVKPFNYEFIAGSIDGQAGGNILEMYRYKNGGLEKVDIQSNLEFGGTSYENFLIKEYSSDKPGYIVGLNHGVGIGYYYTKMAYNPNENRLTVGRSMNELDDEEELEYLDEIDMYGEEVKLPEYDDESEYTVYYRFKNVDFSNSDNNELLRFDFDKEYGSSENPNINKDIIAFTLSNDLIKNKLDEFAYSEIKMRSNRESIRGVSGSRLYFDLDIDVAGAKFEYIVEDPSILRVTNRGEIIGLKPGTTNVTIKISKEGYEDNEVTIPVQIDKPLEIDFEQVVLGDNEDNIKYLKKLLDEAEDVYFDDSYALLDIVDLSNLIIKNASVYNEKSSKNILKIDAEVLKKSYEKVEPTKKDILRIIREKDFYIPKKISTELLIKGNNLREDEDIILHMDKSILDMILDVEYLNIILGDVELTFKLSDLEEEFLNKDNFKIIISKEEKGYSLEYMVGDKPVEMLDKIFDISIPVSIGESNPDYFVVYKDDMESLEKVGGHYEVELDKIRFSTKTRGNYYVEEDEKSYGDIEDLDEDVQKAIKFMTSKGIMDDREEGKFDPDTEITRSEFSQLIIKSLYKLDRTLDTSFTDVSKDDKYHDYIASSEKEEIVNGYDDSTFRGEDTINKEEIVSIAARVLNDKGDFLYPEDEKVGENIPYLDKDDISEWAKKEVSLAYRDQLVGIGINKLFNPKVEMTRADAADTIYRLFELLYRPSPAKIEIEEVDNGIDKLPIIMGGGLVFIGVIGFLVYRNKKNGKKTT